MLHYIVYMTVYMYVFFIIWRGGHSLEGGKENNFAKQFLFISLSLSLSLCLSHSLSHSLSLTLILILLFYSFLSLTLVDSLLLLINFSNMSIVNLL